MEILTNFKALIMVIFFFGASIFVHELGHFLAARWRGLKVTRFSIGFGPKLFGWKRDGIEYIVAALPIGGYVALPQLGHMEMIEGKADEEANLPISWTSKVIVLVAGAFFNLLFTLVLGSLLFLIGGRPVPIYNDITTIGIIGETLRISDDEQVPNPAFEAGLLKGDNIKAIDGKSVKDWESVQKRIIFGTKRTLDGVPLTIFTIERNGEILEKEVLPVIAGFEKLRTVGISPELPDLPPLIGGVFEGFPADHAGIKPGDELLRIDGEIIRSTPQISEYIQQNPTKEIQFELLRDGQTVIAKVTPKLAILRENEKETPAMGVAWTYPNKYLKETPIKQIGSVMEETVETLGKLINPKSNIKVSNMSGPVGMGRIIYQSAKWDFKMVLWVVIIVNINLAILNLLPIPVLDGGHILFATIEKIRGKELPQNLMMSLQGTFVLALLTLMLYVTIFDGRRIFTDVVKEKDTSSFKPRLIEFEQSE
ncbi:MAG: RIP metalloprotease RseP [Opitutaceae bacterium]|nr:RIP metalloprotease RseP [Opitutaceae bacterium]